MKVAIIGSGYVGLVTGVCLSELGHSVTCLDLDAEKVNQINKGSPPFFESGLETLLLKNIKNCNFIATTDIKLAMAYADLSIISVGTPFSNGSIDLVQLEIAFTAIAKHLSFAKSGHVVCVKSTVTPGTTELIFKKTIEKSGKYQVGINIGLAMNPEFLAEGTAVSDFMNSDRVVIGVNDALSRNKMLELYEPLEKAEKIVVSINSAEMAKYLSNAFFATLISFTNQISNLCEKIDGVDVVDVIKTLYYDRRISVNSGEEIIFPLLTTFIHPGIGYGGSCFPKDIKALISYGKERGVQMDFIDSVDKINLTQSRVFLELITRKFKSLKGVKIGLLGLSFKPGTTDLRESVAIVLINDFLKNGAKVYAHDPMAINLTKQLIPENESLNYFEDLNYLKEHVDCFVLATAWPEYKLLESQRFLGHIPVFDGRRFLDKRKIKNYFGVGMGLKNEV